MNSSSSELNLPQIGASTSTTPSPGRKKGKKNGINGSMDSPAADKNQKNRASARTAFSMTVGIASRQREAKLLTEMFSENMQPEPVTGVQRFRGNYGLNPTAPTTKVKVVGRVSKRVLGESGGRYKKNFAYHRQQFLVTNKEAAHLYDEAASDHCFHSLQVCLTCCAALSTMKCAGCLSPLCSRGCQAAHKEQCTIAK